MTFKEACYYTIPFGKYNGRTIVGCDNLVYLDWLIKQHWFNTDKDYEDLKLAIKIYLSEPHISQQLYDIKRSEYDHNDPS